MTAILCPHCGHELWYVGNPDGFKKVTPERKVYYCDGCSRGYHDHGDSRLVLHTIGVR